MQLNIPQTYLNTIADVKNKFSKLFIVGFLITYMREEGVRELDVRATELHTIFNGVLSPHLLKVILKELDAENVIHFDNDKYKKERVYNVRFTDDFAENFIK